MLGGVDGQRGGGGGAAKGDQQKGPSPLHPPALRLPTLVPNRGLATFKGMIFFRLFRM